MADYNKAIELDPNDASAYYNRGVVLGEFIVNRHLVAGSEEYRLTGQGNSSAEP
ncbi:MAG: tetratricopeptide repeat protein [Dehalococcoidia bacterium]